MGIRRASTRHANQRTLQRLSALKEYAICLDAAFAGRTVKRYAQNTPVGQAKPFMSNQTLAYHARRDTLLDALPYAIIVNGCAHNLSVE